MQILPDHSLVISLGFDYFALSTLIGFAHIDQEYLPLDQLEPDPPPPLNYTTACIFDFC